MYFALSAVIYVGPVSMEQMFIKQNKDAMQDYIMLHDNQIGTTFGDGGSS